MTGPTIHVPGQVAGRRLLEFLSERLINEPKSRLRRLVAEGYVRLNGNAAATVTILREGDAISLPPGLDLGPPAPSALTVEVLREDAEHLVINKPAGVVVLPARGGGEDSLYHALAALLNRDAPAQGPYVRPHVVHRLDRETSGVLLVAKGEAAARALSLQFQNRTVRKCYLGVIEGVLPRSELTIDIPLRRAHKNLATMAPDMKAGKSATTRAEVKRAFGHFCLLQLQPLTGRQHQIRAHLCAIGYPLAVDFLYGRRSRLTGADFNAIVGAEKLPSEAVLLERCPLHACALAYSLPRSGEPVEARAPMPQDMEHFLDVLESSDRPLSEEPSRGSSRQGPPG